MQPNDPTMPPPANDGLGQPIGQETCYRHPSVVTGVHCTRCERPICPDCMIPAPVGHQCPECVHEAKREFRKSGSGPQQVRSVGGTPVTIVLLGLVLAGYGLQVLTGGGINGDWSTAMTWGVDQPLAVATGEYWRLVTAIFLHGGLLHLLANSWGLYVFGSFIERTLGRGLLVGMFFCTGIVASATSYALSANTPQGICGPSLGASGAVFGLFGVFLAYNYRRRDTQLGRALLRQMMPWLIINIFISLSPGIDWRAHLGGIVAGFLGGFGLEALTEKTKRKTAAATVLVGLLLVAVVLIMWKTPQVNAVIAGLPPEIQAACNLT